MNWMSLLICERDPSGDTGKGLAVFIRSPPRERLSEGRNVRVTHDLKHSTGGTPIMAQCALLHEKHLGWGLVAQKEHVFWAVSCLRQSRLRGHAVRCRLWQQE